MYPVKALQCSILALLFTLAGCAADLRPDSLKLRSQPRAHDEEKGRALLARAAQQQGAQAWSQHQAYTLVLRDQWSGLMPKLLNPWPSSDVRVRVSFRANSFDARAEFLSGDEAGLIWGLQSWKTYEAEPGQPIKFKDNDDAAFILPALQYLMEFIFREHGEQLVVYAGAEVVRGKRYERVFLTWRSLEPSDEVDQYMVYLDGESGRAEKIFYTVRDMMDAATGAIHFDDWRVIDGISVPFRQRVTFDVHDDPADYAHMVTIESITWGTPTPTTFFVDPKLSKMDDAKP